MEIRDVLFFDTETTGIPDRAAHWDTDFMDYPHVVQLAWLHGCVAHSHIIRPDGWTIPDEAVAVHGITNERALAEGEPFAAVVDMFIQDCHEAGLICGHNIHFDTGIIKANILRELGREYYDANDVESALYKGKRIDTMRSAMKWVDARFASGRLKFPNLSELYERCFPGETFPAHDAFEDTQAVARCLPILVQNGIVELKVKEYPEEAPKQAETAPIHTDTPEKAGNGPKIASNSKDDKLPAQQEKAPENENSAKITADVATLLDANDF